MMNLGVKQMIKSISIKGLRGFGEEKTIKFSSPNGESGSGITIFVGSNNTGKTTIIEALRCFNSTRDNPPSFSERKRNIKCENGMIHLKLLTDNDTYTIDTVSSGGSSTVFKKNNLKNDDWWEGPKIFSLQSRRFVDYEFDKSFMERNDYIRNQQMNYRNRSASISEFNCRLFKMQDNKNEFDKLLKRVLGYNLEWTIEQNDGGRFFLKVTINGCIHSSEGLGDGIWSVFTICDSLYDSKPGDTIAIDEPELSLHPSYQKKILCLFNEYSKDRQILISTHSPYLIDFKSIINGASLYRTVKDSDGNLQINLLSQDSSKELKGFLQNINQPHTLGLEAKEIFFLEDNIILTEGQEDVIMYKKASEELEIDLSGTFFGWGSGGASNIQKIAAILRDLGYKKVVAVFDGDKSADKDDFSEKFPMFKSFIITQPDIRDKKAVHRDGKSGMMTENGKLKEENSQEMRSLFQDINEFFSVKA